MIVLLAGFLLPHENIDLNVFTQFNYLTLPGVYCAAAKTTMMRDRHHTLPDANFDGPALLNEQAQLLSESAPSDINFLQFLKLRLSAQQRATAQRNYWQRVQQEVEGGATATGRSVGRSATASSTASNAIPIVDTEAYPAASSWNVQTTPVRTPAHNPHHLNQQNNTHNNLNSNDSTQLGDEPYGAAHSARSPFDDSSMYSGSVASRHDVTQHQQQQQLQQLQQSAFASRQLSNEHLPAAAAKRAVVGESSALESPLTNSQLEGRSAALDEKPAMASGTPQVPVGVDEMKGVTLLPCPHCGRTFAPDRLQRHAAACERQQTANPKAKGEGRERKVSSGSAGSHGKAERGAANVKVGGVNTSVPGATATAASSSAASGGGVGASAGAPPSGPPKMEKWRRQSAQLRSALAGASAVEDDRVPCPHCGRRFSEDAAGRHIPICKAKEERHS